MNQDKLTTILLAIAGAILIFVMISLCRSSFVATTKNGVDWEYGTDVQGMFYMRIIEDNYAVAKYKNDGGIAYKRKGSSFEEVRKILPNMRHCAYHNHNHDLNHDHGP